MELSSTASGSSSALITVESFGSIPEGLMPGLPTVKVMKLLADYSKSSFEFCLALFGMVAGLVLTLLFFENASGAFEELASRIALSRLIVAPIPSNLPWV